MGCDFYIYTYLEIKHTNGVCYIELSHQKGYECDCMEPMQDSDDEDTEAFKQSQQEYFDRFLVPILRPILIYANNQFTKKRFKEKYEPMIEEKMYSTKYWRDTGYLTCKENIITIEKIEVREKV